MRYYLEFIHISFYYLYFIELALSSKQKRLVIDESEGKCYIEYSFPRFIHQVIQRPLFSAESAHIAHSNAFKTLLQIIGNINIQIFQCLDHGSLDVGFGSSASNLPSSAYHLFALRINDSEVPPSGVLQTSGPLFHCLISFGVGSIPCVEGAGHK